MKKLIILPTGDWCVVEPDNAQITVLDITDDQNALLEQSYISSESMQELHDRGQAGVNAFFAEFED